MIRDQIRKEIRQVKDSQKRAKIMSNQLLEKYTQGIEDGLKIAYGLIEENIPKTETDGCDDLYSQCGECGQIYLENRGYDYCPNCGRRLEETS